MPGRAIVSAGEVAKTTSGRSDRSAAAVAPAANRPNAAARRPYPTAVARM